MAEFKPNKFPISKAQAPKREVVKAERRASQFKEPLPPNSAKDSCIGCFVLALLCWAAIAALRYTFSGSDATQEVAEESVEKDSASSQPKTIEQEDVKSSEERTINPRSVAPSYSAPATLEFMLSVIDDRPGDELVMNRFRSLLAQLDATYVETPMQIADMTGWAQEVLRNEGISVSLLNLMEGMNTIWPMPMPNQTYSSDIALYMALRQKGYSHERAITTLVDFVYGLMIGTSQAR